MSFIPRDYQEFSDEALWRFVHNHPDKNPLVVMPTGTGKSLNMAMFIWRIMAAYPSVRVMMLTHVKELIAGNYKTLLRLWPAAPAGVYSAGLNRKDVYSPITFGGVQSVANRIGRFGRIDFLLVDEAHRIGGSDNATYMRVIAELRKANPNLIVIGYTATPFRMGGGMLTDGEIFDAIAFDGSDGEAFLWFIENGYLIRPVPKDPGFQLDDSAISIQAGDFNNREASQALSDQNILERAVDMMIAMGEEQGRQCWMTFNQSIDDAELVADMFRYKGHAVEPVHSKRDDRDDVLKALQAGKLRGVTNKDILTTGFDHPPIDLIGMLRLTRSPGLWVQMLGRGTRPVYAPGFDLTTLEGRLASIGVSQKQTCLVLDFVGNTERLGPINYPVIPKKRKKGGGDPPVRKCPVCSAYHHPSVKVCTECGYVFPVEQKIRDASTADIVRSKVLDLTQPPPPRQEEVVGVTRMVATHHKGRAGKKDTMRVDYFCGFQRYSTWVCFEHPEGSFPRRKAQEWWGKHGGRGPAPTDVSEAVEAAHELQKPKFIKVWVNTKHPEILAYDFRGTRFELPPELGGPPLQDPGPDPMEVPQHAVISGAMGAGYFEDDIPF